MKAMTGRTSNVKRNDHAGRKTSLDKRASSVTHIDCTQAAAVRQHFRDVTINLATTGVHRRI